MRVIIALMLCMGLVGPVIACNSVHTCEIAYEV